MISKKVLLSLAILMPISLITGCSKEQKIDYKDTKNWFALPTTNYDVDTLFFYPTVVMQSANGLIYGTREECIDMALVCKDQQASVYEKETNLYVPFYRQATFDYVCTFGNDSVKCVNALSKSIGYRDLVNALDYYFENFNNGKPFILAGHSQGSCMLIDLLVHYFKKNDERLNRMVAAYSVGFAPSKKMLDDNNLKFTSRYNDFGTVVSWNTEGAMAAEKSILIPDDALVVNPISWKTTADYVGADQSKGARINGKDAGSVCDAQINTTRHTVVCTSYPQTIANPYSEVPGVFSTCALHSYDYSFYYYDIVQNVKDRITAYNNDGMWVR